jgi:nucleoside-diphosphate-sugar epimerase
LAGDRSWAIIRPPAVYGPGDPATLPLFKAAAMGFLPYPAAKGAQVALIHVHDVAMAIVTVAGLLAAGKLPSGQCLELDDGRSDGYQWSEIIAALATAVGHPVRHVRLPRLLLWPIAAANTIRATLTRHAEVLTTAKMAELYHRDWRARPSEFFGPGEWKARFTLEKGFSHTCEWYRKHSLIS